MSIPGLVIIHFLTKLFNSNKNDITNNSQKYFAIELPSIIWCKRVWGNCSKCNNSFFCKSLIFSIPCIHLRVKFFLSICLFLCATSYPKLQRTVFQMTLYLLRHWQCFGENWKHIYFGSHIKTLLSSLFVVFLATVVQIVIYCGHLRNCYVT